MKTNVGNSGKDLNIRVITSGLYLKEEEKTLFPRSGIVLYNVCANCYFGELCIIASAHETVC